MSASKIAIVSASTVAVLAALYTAAGYIAVPAAVQWAVGKYLPGPLNGKNATVESVSFSPWSLALELKNLKVESAAHPGTNVLSLAYLNADASISSLFKMAPVLDSLTVKSLVVDYDQTPAGATAKKTVTSSSMAQGAAGAAKAAKSETKNSGLSLPAMSLADVRLSDSSVRFRDSSQGIDMQATEINFQLPLISTLASSSELPEMTPKLSLKLDGNPITATGRTTKSGATITVSIPKLDAAKIINSLPVSMPVKVKKLALGANITADYTMAKGSNNVIVSGVVNASDISISHQADANTFTARSLDINLGKIDVFGQKAHVASVALTSPRAKARLSRLMSLASVPEAKQPARTASSSFALIRDAHAAQSSGWNWVVDSVKLTDGTVSVIDDTLKTPATLEATGIHVAASNLTQNAGTKSAFDVGMNLAKGSIKAQGQADLSSLSGNADVALSKVDLHSLAPWIRHYGQASVASGLLSANARLSAMAGASTVAKLSGKVSLSNLAATYLAVPASVRLDALDVDIRGIDTSRQTAEVGAVSIASPSVSIARSALEMGSAAQGKSSAKSSAGKTKQTASAKKPEASSGKSQDWTWSVDSVVLKNGTATLNDDTLKPHAALTVSQINAKVQNLSSKKGTSSPYSISAAVARGSFASDGKFSLSPLSASAQNKMSGVQLATFNPWLAASGASFTKGVAALNGALNFKQTDKTAVSWKGSMQIDDLNAKKGGTTVLSWDKAVASNINLQSVDPVDVYIELVEINQPMQKLLKQEQKIGSLLNLFTKGKHASKIESFETKLRKDVKLRNLTYKNGQFSAGRSNDTVGSLLLKGLNSVLGK